MVKIIISGGQTGVDRAALDSAINLNIAYGGWCPKGRLDEMGVMPEKYNQLREVSGHFYNEKENYDARTKLNIRDSDGTLIVVPQRPLPAQIKDGTLLTIDQVKKQNKPFLIISLSESHTNNSHKITEWISLNNITTLNIAGPRESNSPGIYQLSFFLLSKILYELKAHQIKPKL